MTTASAPAAAVGTFTVVVADDDAEAREVCTKLLTALGFQVIGQASTGQDAIAQAKALRPDAVLLDVHMPDGNGIEAAQAIAADNAAIAIVLLSGDGTISLTEDEVASTSAVAFLSKPTPPTILASTLKLAIARARELRSARTETAAAMGKLEDRKLIERAKGILMRRTGASEQEAYRILQRSSQDRSMPMAKVAQAVLASEPDAARPALHEVGTPSPSSSSAASKQPQMPTSPSVSRAPSQLRG
jgi:response regulator NasT